MLLVILLLLLLPAVAVLQQRLGELQVLKRPVQVVNERASYSLVGLTHITSWQRLRDLV